MPQPSQLPQWATGGGANIVDPGAVKKALGWVAGELPPDGYFNWLFNTIYLWTVYLQGLQGENLVWTGTHVFNNSLTTKGSVLINSILAVPDGFQSFGGPTNGNGGIGTGDGTGSGLKGFGGGTDGPGLWGIGGPTNGPGGKFEGTGTGAGVQASADTGFGVTATSTSGGGLFAESNSANAAISAQGNSSGAGIFANSATGRGGTFAGGGSSAGLQSTGGATGAGGAFIGGSTSGAGLTSTATSGNGGTFTGGGAGSGISTTGGATNGNGVTTAGTGAGHGVFSNGGVTGKGGVFFGGSTSGNGLESTGGPGGTGVVGSGGSGGGRGGSFTGTGSSFGLNVSNSSSAITDAVVNIDAGASANRPALFLNGGYIKWTGITSGPTTYTDTGSLSQIFSLSNMIKSRGSVDSAGNLIGASYYNAGCSRTSQGLYAVTFVDPIVDYTPMATLNQSFSTTGGMIVVAPVSSTQINVFTFDKDGNLQDLAFSFLVI